MAIPARREQRFKYWAYQRRANHSGGSGTGLILSLINLQDPYLKTGLHLHKEGYKGKTSWEELGKSLQDLDQTISILQTSAMNLRMIPVHQIFTRFPKVVRDLAKNYGKKIELHFIGEETEIDKQIAEELVDPLTHLLRNSIDHGIEEIEERKSKGRIPSVTSLWMPIKKAAIL